MVIEACKRDGVKSTTRGTVAGLGIEVSSVCGVLAMLGKQDDDDDNESSLTPVNSHYLPTLLLA